MRNHIARLTQLGSGGAVLESATRCGGGAKAFLRDGSWLTYALYFCRAIIEASRLEAALAQSEADNKQLRSRVAALEKRLREVGDGDGGTPDLSVSGLATGGAAPWERRLLSGAVGTQGGGASASHAHAPGAGTIGEDADAALGACRRCLAPPDEATVLALQHRLKELTATLQTTQRELRTLQMVKVGGRLAPPRSLHAER